MIEKNKSCYQTKTSSSQRTKEFPIVDNFNTNIILSKKKEGQQELLIKNIKSCDILNTSSSQRSNASNSVENYKKKNPRNKKQINNIRLQNVSRSTLTSNNTPYKQRNQELMINNLTLYSINNKASSQLRIPSLRKRIITFNLEVSTKILWIMTLQRLKRLI